MKLELKHLDDKWIVTTPSDTEHIIEELPDGRFCITCEAGEVYGFASLEDALLYIWGLII